MGNCLRTEETVVRNMKTDGKVLENKASIIAEDVLSEFKGEALPVPHCLIPNNELLARHRAPQTREPKFEKKVRFSEPKSTDVGDSKKSGLRIKLVISRRELKELLENGIVSLNTAVPGLQTTGTETTKNTDKCYSNEKWTPLKCIPEVDL